VGREPRERDRRHTGPDHALVCKLKLSQDKDPVSQSQVIAALRSPGRHHHPELADDMARVLGEA
jgi:hypothetical protein